MDEAATCTDIDECAVEQDDCDVNAACENGAGNFTCVCREGYAGNGTVCDSLPDKTSAAKFGAISIGVSFGWVIASLLALY